MTRISQLSSVGQIHLVCVHVQKRLREELVHPGHDEGEVPLLRGQPAPGPVKAALVHPDAREPSAQRVQLLPRVDGHVVVEPLRGALGPQVRASHEPLLGVHVGAVASLAPRDLHELIPVVCLRVLATSPVLCRLVEDRWRLVVDARGLLRLRRVVELVAAKVLAPHVLRRPRQDPARGRGHGSS
eukprot:CAMPEP_0168395400 /NCGR_PEP_ID=MMETSP0228-20121227/20024_1 /TAXON_ID=133427 /ORGANISM="Protoceratium reticulatum, Strain CCCM 535 (=CCMP 1889)" /LENGTH=184 /DNA_ID=CAMNT_0008408831 /DNA_START=53 /DNA_END=604 /DNA_ORIENTATION=-